MKPTAGLSRLDTNSAGLTLPIPSTTFRALPTSKRSAIAIESYFAHRKTSRPDLAFELFAVRPTVRVDEKLIFIPWAPRRESNSAARWRTRCNYARKWQFTRLLLTADSITKTFAFCHFSKTP
jgi:hypothetical protein